MVNDLFAVPGIKIYRQAACGKPELVVTVYDWVVGGTGKWLICLCL